MRAADCLDPDTIAALIAGSLAPERAEAARAHLGGCELCRAMASGLRPAVARGGALKPGDMVGRYRLLRLVGAGGMGQVFLAHDPGLDRHVALKLLRDDLDPSTRHLLRREARLMARVSHPNVVPVFDVGTWAGGDFLTMEFVEGVSLSRWLRERRPKAREVLAIFQAAGAGLAAAHAAGLVHRDFKPQNVLVSGDGRVRVIDFGLARTVLLGSPSGGAPTIGALGGTPRYMAPEQWVGVQADARSDQFSFCVALYEALSGELPFGASPEVGPGAAATLGWPLRSPPTPRLPRAVWRAIARGLLAEPEARHPSMQALLRALGGSSRWWWVGAAAGVAAVAAVSSLARPPPCAPASFAPGAAWDGTRREAVRRAFLATGLPYAEDNFRSLERALDRYAGEWVTARSDLCLAERHSNDTKQGELARQTTCLERRRLELGVLTDELTRADGAVLGRSLSVLGALGPVDGCRSERADDGHFEWAAVEPLYRDLALARTSTQMGRYQASLEAADRALERARGVSRPALEAEASLARGEAYALLGRSGEAEGAMRDAYVLAEGARAERVKAMAARALALLLSCAPQRSGESFAWSRLGFVALDRLDGDAWVEALLLNATAAAHACLEEHEQAAELLKRSAEALGRAKASDEEVASVRANLALVYHALGRLGEARALYQATLATLAFAYGPGHPKVATALANAAVCSCDEGRYDEAQRRASGALATLAPTLGRAHPSSLRALEALCLSLDGLGRGDEALTCARDRLSLVEGRHSAESVEVADARADLGVALGGVGRHAEALRALDRALRSKHALLGEGPWLAPQLVGVAEARLSLGQTAAARASLERARRVLTDTTPSPVLAARLDYALARAIERDDPTEAERLGARAREALRALPTGGPARLAAAANAWRESGSTGANGPEPPRRSRPKSK